jgi:phytoene desaturase
MAKKITVIGGGIAGLATAALLAKDGYQVTVLEKNNQLGGRARRFKAKGFSFDMGPSWYMMPEVFDKFFAFFGKKTSDFYQLIRIKNHYKVFIENRQYTIKDKLPENLKLFNQLGKNGGQKLKKFLKECQYVYELVMDKLVYYDYLSLQPLIDFKLIKNFLAFDFFRTFHQAVSAYFKNPDLQKILEFTTVFLGGSPYNTPAFYKLITHTDFNLGIYHPIGGIHKIIEALEKICLSNNVEIKTNQKADKIAVANDQAYKVFSGKKEYLTDAIVCTCDYQFAETKLLEKKYQTYPLSYWQKKTLAPSAFLIYLGVKGKIKNAEHHNLYFDQSWEKHFKDVYLNPGWPKNPSYYVHCPSINDPSLAPKNCETVIILVPVAPGLKDDEKTQTEFSSKIISHFEKLINYDLEKNILFKKIFTHKNFINDYNAYKGAAFGLAHTLFQTAIFRPKNKSRKIKNLYYAGQYTNPGVGMPICLLSSQIVYNLIINENG